LKIEGVIISSYRYDVALTRICVASIRYWYPDIPIWLVKDRHYGDFSTREIEKHWRAQVYPDREKTWHFPLLAFVAYTSVQHDRHSFQIIAVLIAFLVAILSTFLLEEPPAALPSETNRFVRCRSWRARLPTDEWYCRRFVNRGRVAQNLWRSR
jgi:hypothetical protein